MRLNRYILLLLAGIGFGILFVWIDTFEKGTLKHFIASFSIIALLLFFYFLSNKIMNIKMFRFQSFIEGIIFFSIMMAVYRLGDHLFGNSNLSYLLELILIICVGGFSGIMYVLYIRWLYK